MSRPYLKRLALPALAGLLAALSPGTNPARASGGRRSGRFRSLRADRSVYSLGAADRNIEGVAASYSIHAPDAKRPSIT